MFIATVVLAGCGTCEVVAQDSPVRFTRSISCASSPTGGPAECISLVAELPNAVFDKCQQLPKCIVSSGSQTVEWQRPESAVGSPEAIASIQGANLAKAPSLAVTGNHVYAFWAQWYLPGGNFPKGADSAAVMWSRKSRTAEEGSLARNSWSTPDTLIHTDHLGAAALDVAVTGEDVYLIIPVGTGRTSGSSIRHFRLTTGRQSPQEVVLNTVATGYTQIEVLRDSIYLAYTGTILSHGGGPKASKVRGEDSNNIFLMARHRRDPSWTAPRLIHYTGSGKAHNLKLTTCGEELCVWFTEHPSGYQRGTIRKRKVGDENATDILDIPSMPSLGLNIHAMSGFDDVLIAELGITQTRFHWYQDSEDLVSWKPQFEKNHPYAIEAVSYVRHEGQPHIAYVHINLKERSSGIRFRPIPPEKQ